MSLIFFHSNTLSQRVSHALFLITAISCVVYSHMFYREKLSTAISSHFPSQ